MAVAALVMIALPAACRPRGGGEPGGKAGRDTLHAGKADPHETKGAPYKPAPKNPRVPNEDADTAAHPVPTGPQHGDMKPANPPIKLVPAEKAGRDSGGGTKRPPANKKFRIEPVRAGADAIALFQARPLYFRQYHELDNTIPSTSTCCPEISVAEQGQTIMATGNDWMALSKDGGGSYAVLDPTTIFPQDDGGFCCDQVVIYLPRQDMFVWLMQYWKGGNGKNRIRIAAQTTANVRSSNGTWWTYWDFLSDDFDTGSSLDYNDIAVGDESLWWTSQNGKGRVVVRIALSEIAKQGGIGFQFTGGTDALWSDLTQNATNTVYWAGHQNNSQMLVFSMKDGDGFYSWRTVNIDSWPNGQNSTKCPDGTDWMPFELNKHYVFGNALQNGNVWFSWLAAAGGVFPNPHVQMVRIDPNSWTKQEQVQIWNPTIAFQDAYLSTNNQGELGMEIAFGSGGFYPSSAAGVWGDFVVYYPRLSTLCPGRWGDYNHSRRAGSDGAQWVSGGYTNETDSHGAQIARPHFIRFSR
jgi:hypothetical protein